MEKTKLLFNKTLKRKVTIKMSSKTTQTVHDRDTSLSPKNLFLGVQHLFAMFGATVLVPMLTGLSVSTALVCAGIGTLIFHVCTKFKVPVFLGSSFAFIPVVSAITATEGVQSAQSGIIAAGLMYLLFSVIVSIVGVERIRKLFPPIVTGPVIIVIGLGLGYAAVNNSTGILNSFFADGSYTPNGIDVLIALVTIASILGAAIYAKGFFKIVPILIGMISGYIFCLILSLFGLYTLDFSAIASAPWINIPFSTVENASTGATFFSIPKFSLTAILTIAPVAIVTFMEHIGDITSNGTVVGKDFLKNPGLSKTLMGDGLATLTAGLLGGPANTTYSENTAVLATTKNYNTFVLELAAVFAIVLGFVGKFGGFLRSIPNPVIGGVGIVLYGMIAAIGLRSIVDANIDFSNSRNLLIVAVILCTGIGVSMATYSAGSSTGIPITIGSINFSLSGLFIAVVLGVVLNLILPAKLDKED